MSKKEKIVVISGGFDPIHSGHLRLIKEAQKLGDKLVVILNNDNWLKRKKTHVFMPQKERKEILECIKGVDQVVISFHPKNPQDMSVSREILKIKPNLFVKGWEKRKDVPEAEACKKIGCQLIFNVGKGGKIQSSSGLLARYVEKIKPRRQFDINKILKNAKIHLVNSRVNLPIDLKLKAVKIMLGLMSKKSGFGLFVILGWKDKWRDYTDIPDAGQDIYIKHPQNILQSYKTHKYDIETTVNFDGAILINNKGTIIHSGIIIEGLRPKVVADKINPGNFRDLSEQFGFHKKVHARHLSAITASYIFKGTTVVTVSEETDSLHIFEGGKIVYRLHD